MQYSRWLFALAAFEGLVLGLWLLLSPTSLAGQFGAEAPLPPLAILLAVVLILCGCGYGLVALWPERGGWLAGAGLAVKVLLPAGWLIAVARGDLPTRLFPLVLLDDLVWWFPFLFYLVRDLPARRVLITWIGVALHVLACLGLLAVAGGTEIVPEMAERARWVAAAPLAWAVTWTLWTEASLSLLAFFVVWGAYLRERGVPPGGAVAACLICATGVAFDLVGEGVNLVCSTRPGLTVAEFGHGARLYGILSAATANGFYCVGGLVLSGLAWRAKVLRGPPGVLGFAMWTVGLALSGAAVLDHGPGMIVTGAGVMALYIPWASLVGWQMRTAPDRGAAASPRAGTIPS